MEENCMKFSISNVIGLLLIVAGTIVGIAFQIPLVNIGSVVAIVVGSTLAIKEQAEKINIKGWVKYLFLALLISGTSVLAIGGYSESTIMSVVGAVVLIATIIVGGVVDKTKKVEEKK